MFTSAQVKEMAKLVHKLADEKDKERKVISGLGVLKRLNDMELPCKFSIECEVRRTKFVFRIFLTFAHLNDAKQIERLFRQEITALQKRQPLGIEPLLVQRSHTEIETRYAFAA